MNSQTLLETFKKWFSKTAKYPENTKKQYLILIKNYLTYLENFKIFALKDASINKLQKFIHFNKEKEYAPAFVNLRLSALNLFYSWAYQNNYCQKNLITEYRKNKLNSAQSLKEDKVEQPSSIVYLTSREQQLLLKANLGSGFNETRNKAIITLILTTGMFLEELINLNPDDLNMNKNLLTIDACNVRERTISLKSAICNKDLKNWLEIRNAMLNGLQNPFLFFTKNLTPITRRLLHQIVSQYMTEIGIKQGKAYPEVLRQTAICNMFVEKMPIEEIQKVTGIKTLANISKYQRLAQYKVKL